MRGVEGISGTPAPNRSLQQTGAAMPAAVQGPTPRTPPDEVEGLVALVGPAGGEKGEYTLHLVIDKLGFPEGRRPLGAATNATYWTGPTPDSPKPGPAGSPHPHLA